MLTFVFIVTMWTPDGVADQYAMDTGLTGQDCIARLVEYLPTADAMGWQGSCRIDEQSR